MGRTQTLKGIFTNRVSDAVAHSYKLCGLSEDSAYSLFRSSIEEFQERQMEEFGRVDEREMSQKLYKPTLLLPEHLKLQRCENLVATISIPPEIAEALSLMHRQVVEVQVNPEQYSPEKGLMAIAARTDAHPEWVHLDR
jgi:hypothetical protein